MSGDFAAQVEDWVRNSKELLTGVFHESVQRVVEEMQRPGPSKASIAKAVEKGSGLGKNGRASKKAVGPVKPGNLGGRLPVDTGFLWHSFQMGDSMPEQRENPADDTATYSYNAGPTNMTISNTPLGQTLYGGWTAAYAAKVNFSYGYMFLDMAVQQWPQIVNQVQAELKGRLSAGQ